jgi:hypothetical protein
MDPSDYLPHNLPIQAQPIHHPTHFYPKDGGSTHRITVAKKNNATNFKAK